MGYLGEGESLPHSTDLPAVAAPRCPHPPAPPPAATQEHKLAFSFTSWRLSVKSFLLLKFLHQGLEG